MRRITVIRLALTVIATPFLVVGYLNIEKWAETHGYDLYLTRFMSGQSDSVVGPFVTFALRPEMPFIASAVLAFISGIWCDAWLRRGDLKRISPKERMKSLGNRSVDLAGSITNTLNHVSPQRVEGVASDYWSEYLPIAFDLEKSGIKTPEREIRTRHDLEVVAHYLRFVGRLLAGGHLKQAKQTARNLTGQPNRLSVGFLLQWLQALAQKTWRRIHPG